MTSSNKYYAMTEGNTDEKFRGVEIQFLYKNNISVLCMNFYTVSVDEVQLSLI